MNITNNEQAKKQIPENPDERKIIIIGDYCFLNEIREEKEQPMWYQRRHNSNICVVNVDDYWQGELFDKLKSKDLLIIGTALVQDPYETDLYIPLKEENVANSLLDSAKKRYRAFEEVVNKLGAISLSIEEAQCRRQEGHIKGGGDYKFLDASGSFDIANQLQESIKSSSTFPGGKPDVQAAFDVLKRYNLMGDSELKSLIELRRGNNPILTKEVKWTVCHELSVSLELGVELALPGISKGGNLAANLKIASNSMLTWRVEFAAD